MAPEFGVTELPIANDIITRSEEMENTDIEDGEILEDESNSNEQTFQNKDQQPEEDLRDAKPEVHAKPEIQNNFEKYFHKEHKNHHNDLHKGSRRDRYSDLHKKRRRIDSEDKYYNKKSKGEDDEDETDEDMIFVLGGSLKDSERRNKHLKKPILPDPPDDMLDPIMFNEGENEDPRPYSKRSPSGRRDSLKDRGPSRNINASLMRRRGRGGVMLRKNRLRDGPDSFYSQGKGQRNNDCNSFPHSFNHPRKLEICKFYLMDKCNKREKCFYMHEDFPCQHFHAPNSTCYAGNNCKFYHGNLDEVQRAVVKKYADIPLREADELQDRYYRQSLKDAYAPRNCKDDMRDSRVPMLPPLYDVRHGTNRVDYYPQEMVNVDENTAEAGGQTPIPSPQSMMYDAAEIEEEVYVHTKSHEQKILSEHNEHRRRDPSVELTEFGEEVHRSSHKKKNKKSDDHSDSDKSKKHSEKRKKRSKEEKKLDKEKKKKKEHKRSKKEHSDLTPEPEEVSSPNVINPFTEDAFDEIPDISDGHNLIIFEQNEPEPADALSHLPKKQQELFLRIQQHQKEAEASQNSNVEDDVQEDDVKQDENWYSSDEEQESEPSVESTSPLATLLRTIKTSTSNALETENKSSIISTQVESFATPIPGPSTPPQESESISMVDASQLANINISDDITKLLSSIINTDTSSNTTVSTVTETLPANVENENSSLKGPFSEVSRVDIKSSSYSKAAEDVDLRFPPVSLMNNNLFSTISGGSKDIDLRQLPFKPVPVHDAANEINASITSHPPIEYKLKPLPFIAKVNYATLPDMAKASPNDPRLKKKMASLTTTTTTTPTTTVTTPPITTTPTELPMDPAQLMSTFNSSDPRYLMALKTMTEAARMDPRLADPRMRPILPPPPLPPLAFPGAGVMPGPTMQCEMKLTADPRFDARDPRLSSRNKFPEVINPFPISMPPNVLPLPMPVVKDVAMPPRKEDPRLRFRAAQNS